MYTHILKVDESVTNAKQTSIVSFKKTQGRSGLTNLQLFAKSATGISNQCQAYLGRKRRRNTDTQIHKVVLAKAGFIDDFLQHGLENRLVRRQYEGGDDTTKPYLVDFVWNIAKHDLKKVRQLAKEIRFRLGRRKKTEITVVRTSTPMRIRSISTWF